MASYGDNEPSIRISGNRIDPLSEIRNAGIITSGDVFWVKDPSDADYVTVKDAVGAGVFRDTPAQALTLTATDTNDYVLVAPKLNGAAYALGTAIDITNDRVHLLSLGYTHAIEGYSNTLEGYVSASGIDTEIVKVTASGIELAGFRILGTSGTADGGTLSGGFLNLGTASSGTAHQGHYHDLVVENTQAAAAGGTTDIISFTGNSARGLVGNRFDRIWAGDWSWAPANVVNFGAGTAGPSRTRFADCEFLIDAQATTDRFITLGTGATEFTEFNRCKFINVEAGTAPASAIAGAVLVDNPALMINCVSVNVTNFGTDTELLVTPIQAGTAGAGLHNPGLAIIGTAPIVAA